MARPLRKALLRAVGVALLATLALLAVAPWALRRVLTPERVAAAASGGLGREVRIGTVALHLGLAPRLQLEDVDVRPGAQLARLEVSLRLLPLLCGRLVPAQLGLTSGRLAVTRQADGRLSLGDAPDGGGEAPALGLASLPAIEVEDVEVAFEDRAVAPEPVHLTLRIPSLAFTPSGLGEAARLRARARFGPDGAGGELRLEGQADALPFPGPLEVRATLSDFDPAPVRPYLLERVSDARLDGRLAGRGSFRLEPSGELEGELSLELSEGDLAGALVDLSHGVALDLRLVRQEDVFSVPVGHLRAGRAAFQGVEASAFDLAFGYGEDGLRIEGLDLETFRGASAESLGGVHWDLDVEHTGHVALRSSPGVAGLLFGASEVEARNLQLQLGTRQGSPLRAHLDTVTITGLAPGARARLGLDGRLGGEAGAAALHVAAETAALPDALVAADVPVTVEATVRGLGASELTRLAPPDLETSSSDDARLDLRAELEGPSATRLAGPISAALVSGTLTIHGLAFDAPARLQGRLEAAGAELGLSDARAEAQRVALGDRALRGVRASLSLGADGLTLRALEAAGGEGTFAPLDIPGLGAVELRLAAAAALSLQGAPGVWPELGSPRLRLPSAASLRGAELTLRAPGRPDAPPVALRVEKADATGLTGRGEERLQLNAALGVAGRQGALTLDLRRGGAGPGDFTAEIVGTDLDAPLVLPYLARHLPVTGAPGRIRGRLALQGGTGGPRAGQLELALSSGNLGLGPVRLGAPLALEGQLGWPAGQLALRGAQLRAASGEVADWRSESLHADLAYEDGRLTAHPLVVEAFGGRWTLQGSVGFEDPPAFDFELEAEGAELGRLLARGKPAPPVAEPIRLEALGHVEGLWTGGAHWLDPLSGSARIELHDGFVPSERLYRALWSSFVGRLPGLRALRAAPVEARLERAQLPLRIEDGRVRSDALAVTTSDYRFRGRGLLSGDFHLSVKGDLVLTKQGLDDLLRLAAVAPALRRGLELPPVPLDVGGSLMDPHFRPSVQRLPIALLRGVLGLPVRAGDLVRGAADSVRDLGKTLDPRRREAPQAEPVPPE